MAGFDQIFVQAKQFWATRTQSQRLFLGVGAAATVGLLALFANLMVTPDYKPLISGLESADAQAISADLTAKKIPFQLSPDGKSISVPADQVDAARLDVASNQSTHSGRLGFEIFDKVSWGQTEFDEKVNYQRALEGELERTIVTLGGVKSARVHLVMATDSVFLDREKSAKASVTLKLNRGGLSHDETASIQRLVSGAVEGLKPTDVSIIDADSNQSMGAAGDGAMGEEGAERQLTQRLMATLTPVVGGDHLRASVNVEYDPGTTEENQEKYDPAVSVPLTIQRSDESTGAGAGVGGVPGTTSNVPQNKANVPPPVGEDSAQVSKTENATYGVNKITRHSLEPAGRIKRITAALVVDDSVKRKLGANGKWTEIRTKRSPQELKQIETLAQNAIGLDTTRGDVISVENLAFDRPDEPDVAPVTALDRARKGVSDFSSVVRYAMLLILFVLAYVLMIRPVQKKVLAVSVQLPQQPLLPEMAAALPLLAPSTSMARALALKEQVVQQVKSEPEGSARVVQAWLRGEAE
ncbi:flagellar basal-body MS-ring/collar protein FliF [Granulicella tundricola]|uniref:Flagellar M-ring protein n=1 Tax=Granulicella tundricola (strain ATCC BAA-1859 / DSM 23138 / MP5ACTX9) TaxID=1198114 RepID=E8X643_GRATM|nr:flagellar basal-body MS-ring/collar protein FliF [Granulicella tundricola]ADW70927.1 flagellar M-ring protein FliF [Granulicella tundricola MP5ACTX9]